MTDWLLERPLYCKKCGKLLFNIPTYSPQDYVEALINDLGHCPRCRRKLDISQKELHHEMYFSLRSIIWKLTHPWRLLK